MEENDRWCGTKVKQTSSAVCLDTEWTDQNQEVFDINICSNGLMVATNKQSGESKA
jgi:hypothetical protein